MRSAEEHEAATRAHLDRVARTVEAGLAVKYDRLQVEVRLEAAREALLVARQALDTAGTALNLARGAPPMPRFRPGPSPPSPSPPALWPS